MPIDIPALKSRASLREIVADHVKLTARGKTWWGKCPFHREDTPSFAVHADYWYCHGCGLTGDVIDFTARVQHISKGRAIRLLAERYGVPLGPPVSRAEGQYMRLLRAQAEFWWRGRRQRALERLEDTCTAFFADPTQRNEALADAAGKYLRMLDGINPAIRGKAFLALRTADDAAAWEESRAEVRELARIFGAETGLDSRLRLSLTTSG